MLRANVYCTLISSPGQVKAATGYGSWLVQSHNSLRPFQRVTARALKDGGETSGFQGRNWDPGLEIEVPFEQRPVCNDGATIGLSSSPFIFLHLMWEFFFNNSLHFIGLLFFLALLLPVGTACFVFFFFFFFY